MGNLLGEPVQGGPGLADGSLCVDWVGEEVSAALTAFPSAHFLRQEQWRSRMRKWRILGLKRVHVVGGNLNLLGFCALQLVADPAMDSPVEPGWCF
jgi:hypothetical protein